MALRGSIDDVPIVDVLQFVHLSGKSGTLALTSPDGPAWVEFSHGNIVFARGPKTRSLGELLVESGGLSTTQVHEAIETQRRTPERPPLGKLLLAKKIITAVRLAECVRRQIHEAMMDIANWHSGDFQFDQGNIEVLDGIRVDVAEVLPLLKLNTQFLLFEAVRLFDERQRDKEVEAQIARAAAGAKAPEATPPPPSPLPKPLPTPVILKKPTAAGALKETSEPPEKPLPVLDKSTRAQVTPPPKPSKVAAPPVSEKGVLAAAALALETTPSPKNSPREATPMPPGVVPLNPAAELVYSIGGQPESPRIVGEPTLPPPGRDGPHADLTGRSQHASGILLVGFEKVISPPVTKTLSGAGYRVLGHVPRRDIESQFLTDKRWPQVMVLLWRVHAEDPSKLDELSASLKLLERVVAKHPGWSIVAVVSGRGAAATGRVYAAGARAAVPVEPTELVQNAQVLEGLVAVVGQIWKDSARAANAQAAELRAWVQAKRVTSEMQRALQKASIALELMRVAANSLDRATLFLARDAELIGLGAFGITLSGKPMAESLRGLALTVADDTPLARSLAERTAFMGPTRELGLGQLFFDIAGRPTVDRGVLVPLVGPSKAIGVLYGDNGQLTGPIRTTHAIEIAAAQAGIAYENVLLRMRLDVNRRTAEEAETKSG